MFNYVDKNGLQRFFTNIKGIFALKSQVPTKISQLVNDSIPTCDITCGGVEPTESTYLWLDTNE